jgi:hypothetical protein
MIIETFLASSALLFVLLFLFVTQNIHLRFIISDIMKFALKL